MTTSRIPRACHAKRHLNVQKWSETGSFFNTFLTSKFSSRHNGVHFFDISTSKSGPDLVCFVHLTSKCASRHKGVHFFNICVFSFFTCKCASRHNGVQFFISRCLRTRRFSEPTFRPSGAPNHWKNIVLRDFRTLSRICIYLLSSDLVSSDSSHLCFSTVHIVGSFTSKLPSMNSKSEAQCAAQAPQ